MQDSYLRLYFNRNKPSASFVEQNKIPTMSLSFKKLKYSLLFNLLNFSKGNNAKPSSAKSYYSKYLFPVFTLYTGFSGF